MVYSDLYIITITLFSFGKFHKIDECCIRYATPLIRFKL